MPADLGWLDFWAIAFVSSESSFVSLAMIAIAVMAIAWVTVEPNLWLENGWKL